MDRTRLPVVAAAIMIAAIVTLRQVETTFNVVANTETVAVELSASPQSFELDSVLVFVDFDTLATVFSGTLSLDPGAELIGERISQGPVRLLARGADDAGPIGRLVDAETGHPRPIQRRAVIRLDAPGDRARAGRNLVLPFVGRVGLGQEVASHAAGGMLRSAEVALLAHTVVGDGRYEAGRARLDPGDRFEVDGANDAVGFITVDERSGMTVVYRTRARAARVTRFAAEGYTISTPIRAKLVHDPVIKTLWATVLGILSLYGKIFPKKKGEEGAPEEARV